MEFLQESLTVHRPLHDHERLFFIVLSMIMNVLLSVLSMIMNVLFFIVL